MSIRVTFKEAWSGEADCRQCSLRESVLFAGLKETDFEKIHQPINQFVLKPGQTLYQAAERGDHILVGQSEMVDLLLNLVQATADDLQHVAAFIQLPLQADHRQRIKKRPKPMKTRGLRAFFGRVGEGT